MNKKIYRVNTHNLQELEDWLMLSKNDWWSTDSRRMQLTPVYTESDDDDDDDDDNDDDDKNDDLCTLSVEDYGAQERLG